MGTGVTELCVSQHNTIRRATEAIERADEYWASDELLFEPRFREAEQTVAEVGTVMNPAPRARLDLCLTMERTSRSALNNRQTAAALAVSAVARVYGEATALMLRAAQLDGSDAAFEAEDARERKDAAYVNAKERASLASAKAYARLARDEFRKHRAEVEACISSLK